MEINRKKTKNSLMKLIFGRTGIVLLLLIVQVTVLVSGFVLLGDVFRYLFGSFTVISAAIVIFIMNRNDNPAYKLAWILPVLIFPLFGGLLYLYVRIDFSTLMVRSKIWDIDLKTRLLLSSNKVTSEEVREKNNHLSRLSAYIENAAGMQIFNGSNVKYFSLGEYCFEEMKLQLESAKKFIFMEFFIISDGEMWDAVLDILGRKVEQGVEVRVMYDGMGSLATLPTGYEKQLRQMGIKAKVFQPVVPLLSTIQNNRDHRKILVVDGKCAFTGGINLADEYINKKIVYGHWKDTAIMVTGEAVKSFTLMFLKMWNISEKQPDDYRHYINQSTKEKAWGYVMPFEDNPLISDRVGETVYMDILYDAKKYVHIMTPYFLPDNELLRAIGTASKSGVDIKIIIPHIPDKKIPYCMARSYYNVLLDAGVEVYEYELGFIHAKSFVSDDIKAVVGTVNLDYRSLYLHFECAAYFEGCETVKDVEADFQQTLKSCIKVTKEYYKKIPLLERITGRFLRIFAPLM